MEELVDKATLARLLSVSVSGVDRWQRSRRIPVYVLGDHCVRYDYAQVRASLEKFQRPGLLRFPRQVYRRRPKPVRTIAEQLPLALGEPSDPKQVWFPFAASGA